MLVIGKWEALPSLSDRSKDGEVNLLLVYTVYFILNNILSAKTRLRFSAFFNHSNICYFVLSLSHFVLLLLLINIGLKKFKPFILKLNSTYTVYKV